MKTYKIDPLGKNRPLMLVRGTRLPESFPDSVAEHMAKSLKANCRGVFTTINGEISSLTASPRVVVSREANEDNNTLVVMTEGMQNEFVEWEDNTGKQFRLEHAGRFEGSLFGGDDPYYTGAYKDLRTFVTGAVPYTGQPLVAANAKQWYSYTTPEGVALTFRGCIQAPIKEGADFVGLKIDSINFLSSDSSANFKLTLDCDSAVSLGLRNGMNDNSKPFNMNPGIGWLQIVATDDFKSHIHDFNEASGNGDAEINTYEAYDGFTYNVNLRAIMTQPGSMVPAGNNASCEIYVKSGSALENSIIANVSGYACESFGYDMSGSGDTFPMVEEVSTTLNEEPTIINLTTDNYKSAVVIRFSSVQAGEQLHLDLSDTVTAPGVLFFSSMNTTRLGIESLGSGEKSFVFDIPSGDNVFAYFFVNYTDAGTLTISRTATQLTTIQDKVRNDLRNTYFLSELADNFEVVTLTGENQEVTGSVRDGEDKINKVFVVPAGEGGFKTNMVCLSRQLNKKADETYSTTIAFNLPLNVNGSGTGFEFNKVSDKDVYLLPLGWGSKFVLTAITAEQITSDAALVQTARAPHDSADQVLAAVLAACETDPYTANAKTAFTNKITGFDVSNSGDYIYVNAADVKNMYLNGNAWFEIISKTGEQYKHEFISDAESDGTTTVETILRNHGIPVEGTSIFIAKRYGDTCALLAEPKQTPGFYSADGQLVKAMTKEEVETDYSFDNRPANNNDAVMNATKFVWPDGVTKVGKRVFLGCSGLTSVAIPNTVTSIGDSAFSGTGLTSVTIPEGVTAIGNEAFSFCSGLTSLTIPSTVTSIGANAFNGCTSLNPLTVPNTVTTIGGSAFYQVPRVIYGGTAEGSPWGALEVVAPPPTPGFYSANNQLIKAITKEEVEQNYVYSFCPANSNEAIKNATKFVWPDGVTRVGGNVFADCTALTSVIIPEGVTSIEDQAFLDCSGLTSVTIPSTVTSIGATAFSSCSALTSVTIPEGVTLIATNAFNRCSSLASVTIPSTVTEIRGYAFGDCTGLNPLTVPNTVTTIGDNAFRNVPKVIYSGSATGSPWGALEVVAPARTPGFYNKNGQLIKAMTKEEVEQDGSIGDASIMNATEFVWPEGVTKLGSNKLSGFSKLTSVTIPEGVTTIGNYAFMNCTGLTSVTIPSTVTSIGNNAFYNCLGLTSLEIPAGVTSIGDSAFSSCSNLTSVTIPDSVASIGEFAFDSCYKLNPLTVPNTVTTIGLNAFRHVPKVIYGGSATGSPWGATEVSTGGSTPDPGPGPDPDPGPTPDPGPGPEPGPNPEPDPEPTREAGFYSADGQLIKAMTKEEVETDYTSSNYPAKTNDAVKNATEFVWPDGVTKVGKRVFDSCLALTSITIPNTVTSIGTNAFRGCSDLTSVTIPEGVTSISNSAFNSCSALTSVTIPEGVTSIGNYTFYGCTSLNPLVVPNTVATIGTDAFKDVPKVIYGGTATGSPWGAISIAAS